METIDTAYLGYEPLLAKVAQDLRLTAELLAARKAGESRATTEALEKGVVAARNVLASPDDAARKGAVAKVRDVLGRLPQGLSCVCALIGDLPDYNEIKDTPIKVLTQNALASGAGGVEATPAELMRRLGGHMEGCLNRNTVCLRWGRLRGPEPC